MKIQQVHVRQQMPQHRVDVLKQNASSSNRTLKNLLKYPTNFPGRSMDTLRIDQAMKLERNSYVHISLCNAFFASG